MRLKQCSHSISFGLGDKSGNHCAPSMLLLLVIDRDVLQARAPKEILMAVDDFLYRYVRARVGGAEPVYVVCPLKGKTRASSDARVAEFVESGILAR